MYETRATEADGARPLIGHLHLLAGSKPPHVTLADLADKHGPMFTVRLGVHRTLIVSNWEVPKECFITYDKAFINRPRYLAAEIMGYNYAMFGFSSHLPYWRRIREIATLEVLSNHRLETLRHVRESEMRTSMKELHELWIHNRSHSSKALVEMKRWFDRVNLNIIFKIVIGRRYTEEAEKSQENDQCDKAVRDFFVLTGSFVMTRCLLLRWLDLGGHEKAMKKTAK